MNRQEFLDELRMALQGEVSQAAVNEHLRYYENYIIEESRKGRTEEQVTGELGNPRLIAKTLINTTEQFGETSGENFYSEGYGQDPTGDRKRGFHADYSNQDGWDIRFGRLKLNSWYGKLLLVLLAVLIIVAAAQVVAFLLPIIVPVVLVCLAISFISGRRR